MSRNVWKFIAALGLLCLTAGLLSVPPAAAAPRGKPAPARLTVVIKTPSGVPATVTLSGKGKAVATKGRTGGKASSKLVLKAGSYRVGAPVISFDGRLYAARVTRSRLNLAQGSKSSVQVTYKAMKAADRMGVASVAATRIALEWKQKKSMKVALRRVTGDVPARKPGQGAAVSAKNGAATDTKVAAGRVYSYSLFTKVRGKWAPPVSITVGTPSGDSRQATYVAPASTTIVAPGDKDVPGATGSGVVVKLAPGRPTPLLGSGFVLPQSAALPGGFLGVVTGLSADGRTVTLTAGGLADAFDYYDIATDLGDLPAVELTPLTDPVAGRKALDAYARPQPRAAALANCLGGSYSQQVSVKPILKPGGHFNAGIKKKWGVPVGGHFDVEAKLTTGVSFQFQTSQSLTCGLPFKPVMTTLTTAPLPISMLFNPVAEVAVSGDVTVSNVGFAITGGFWAKGKVGFSNSIDGGIIKELSKSSPTVKTVGGVSASLGGELTIGPGIGTAAAGVIAGVGGRFVPLKLGMGAVFVETDSRKDSCITASAGLEAGLSLNAKAWVGNWSVGKTLTLDALQKQHTYGSPWFWPNNCEKEPTTPTDTVTGDGVTVVDSSTIGSAGQAAYVDGFVPGEKTWVLSTGLVAGAAGSPGEEASTDLGGQGSPTLSALAGGADTHDAVGYHLSLVPSGSRLHVRFMFASEEYPEWVNAGFNDVMAVFVDGQNCAFVPGTSTPVSVDSINAGSNSGYFVDNQGGAAGYSTSMDGLTVPLECVANVTPGSTVNVSIAVADVGDGILDSAVGLLDRGIWSD